LLGTEAHFEHLFMTRKWVPSSQGTKRVYLCWACTYVNASKWYR